MRTHNVKVPNMSNDKNQLDHITLAYEEVEPCVTKVNVSIAADDVDREMKGTLAEFTKMAQLPGFRRGRAPAALLKRRFGKQIDGELVKKIHQDAYRKILDEKNLDIVSLPAPPSEEPSLKTGEDYAFSMEFNVAPEFELPNYKDIKLNAKSLEVTDKDVEEGLTQYRDVFAEYKTVDSPAENGDMLKVSYTSDFTPPEDAPATVKTLVASEENWIWLNEPEVFPGVIEAMTGAEAGKDYDVATTFPEDYRENAVAGKTVNYKITVKEIQRKKPLDSDEELVKRMKLENMDQLKDRIRTNLEARAQQENQVILREQAVDAVADKVSDFPLPPKILEAETAKQLRNMMSRMVRDKEAVEKFKEEKDERKAEAEKLAGDRLKRFFIFRKIAEKEGIQVEQSEIDNQIKGMSHQYGYKENEFRQLMARSGGDEDLHVDLLMGKVTDFLMENAEVEDAGASKKKNKSTEEKGADSKTDKSKKKSK